MVTVTETIPILFACYIFSRQFSEVSWVMGPTNNHERAIARIVDDLDAEDRLSPASIEDVIAHLNFAMTKADSVFLVNYIRWRMDHPIGKQG